MQKPTEIIGFDFDDVLFDFMPTLNRWHNQTYNTAHTIEEYITFELHEVWGCLPHEAVGRVSAFYQSDECNNALPLRDAKEALTILKEKYKLVIITARPESMEKVVQEWLAQHCGGIFDEVIFTNHYFDTALKRTKSSVCVELGVKVFIDDALHNAEDVAAAGIPVLLFDTPWNRTDVSPLITRVSSWREVLEKIQRAIH
ncbi:MAG: hypothetical protein ABIO57_01700 [Candidatus Paceibacterota bacterium]